MGRFGGGGAKRFVFSEGFMLSMEKFIDFVDGEVQSLCDWNSSLRGGLVGIFRKIK